MGADFRQQEEMEQQQWEEEEAQYQAYLWSSLCALRGHIDASLFRACARQLGMDEESSGNRAAPESADNKESFKWH